MISMTNLYKGVKDAAIFGILAIMLILLVNTCSNSKTSRDDYTRNNQRIEAQFAGIRDNLDGIVGGLSTLEETTRTTIDELREYRDEIDQFISDDRQLGDRSLELGLLADRSGRLLQELERRQSETETD